jgi:hypothetical protein
MRVNKTIHFMANGDTSVHSMLCIGKMSEGYTEKLKCGAEHIMVSILEGEKYVKLDFHARYMFFVLCSATIPSGKAGMFSCPIGAPFRSNDESYLLEEI